MKLIDGDKLKEMLHTAAMPMTEYGRGVQTGYMYACAFIDNMPEAETVKHGRWMDAETMEDMCGTDWGEETLCSVCGGVSPCRLLWDFCPHCGARMDGDENAAD